MLWALRHTIVPGRAPELWQVLQLAPHPEPVGPAGRVAAARYVSFSWGAQQAPLQPWTKDRPKS